MDDEAVADFNHRSVVMGSAICGGIDARLYVGTGLPVGRRGQAEGSALVW